jgi:hypothetical protein
MSDNLWAQFRRIGGSPTPRFLAEVVTGDLNGFTIVRLLPGGTLLNVKSKASYINEVGDRVIVQDGAIIEDGPGGTVQNAEI